MAVLLAKSSLVKQYDLSCVERVTCGASTLSKDIENELREILSLKILKQGKWQIYQILFIFSFRENYYQLSFGTAVFSSNFNVYVIYIVNN